MDGTANIRTAVFADLDQVVNVENACFDCDRFSRRQLGYLISSAQGVCYVAESNKQIVGYISLLWRSGSKSLRVYSVAVRPDFRGMRLGERFVDQAKEYACLNGFCKITLEVRPDNIVAINLYRKFGFTVTSVIENYYGDSSNAFRMKLEV